MYPDVAMAVASGGMPSGLDHFDEHGEQEGRTFPITLDE